MLESDKEKMKEFLLNHVINTNLKSSDIHNNKVMKSASKGIVRFNIYDILGKKVGNLFAMYIFLIEAHNHAYY